MNLITPLQKTYYQAAIDDLHDTFARNVVFWKDPDRILVAEEANFNYFYRGDNQPSVQETVTPVSGVFPVRIRWGNPNTFDAPAESLPIKAEVDNTLCRLKMKPDAFAFINGYQRIDVDGRACDLQGFSQPHGLIDVQYITVFVKERQ